MSRSAASSLEKLDMKALPLSLMTASGSPWCLQTCSRKRCATPAESTVVTVGMVWMHLDNLSTTTRMALYPLDSGSSPMVLMEITSQFWYKLSDLLHQEGLAAVAGITPCYIAGNIVGDQLQHLPPPWVASYHRVMVGMDDIMAELGVSWDIHTSPVHDQVSVSFPFIRLEHACFKLSEHFDYCVIIVHASLDTFHQLIASTVH